MAKVKTGSDSDSFLCTPSLSLSLPLSLSFSLSSIFTSLYFSLFLLNIVFLRSREKSHFRFNQSWMKSHYSRGEEKKQRLNRFQARQPPSGFRSKLANWALLETLEANWVIHRFAAVTLDPFASPQQGKNITLKTFWGLKMLVIAWKLWMLTAAGLNLGIAVSWVIFRPSHAGWTMRA